jgi:surface antigen
MLKFFAGISTALTLLLLGAPATAQLGSFTKSGLELTTEDWQMLEAAAAKLYLPDEAQVGAVESWSNVESGNSGSIQLLQTGAYQGMPCRKLQHQIEVRNVADPYRFIVDRCKTPDGSWKVR